MLEDLPSMSEIRRIPANNQHVSSAVSADCSYCCVAAARESTATHLTHILSRCSDPHLTSQRLPSAAQPVNFTMLHGLCFWLPTLRAEVVNNRERSEAGVSTCIRGRASHACRCAPSHCSSTKGLTRRAAQPR